MDDILYWDPLEADESIRIIRNEETVERPSKLWFIKEVNENNKKPFELARQHGIRPKRVAEWARLAKKGQRICESTGRPKSLDEESLRKLRDMRVDNSDLGKLILRDYVRAEYIESVNRVEENIVGHVVKRKRMSRRSVIRYVEKLY